MVLVPGGPFRMGIARREVHVDAFYIDRLPVTNAQFTRALGRALGRPTVVPFPAFAAKLVFGQMAEEALLGGQRALPPRLLDTGFTFRYAHLDGTLAHVLAQS